MDNNIPCNNDLNQSLLWRLMCCALFTVQDIAKSMGKFPWNATLGLPYSGNINWIRAPKIIMKFLDLVKFVMCALVSRVHMMFFTLRKGYTVPGNQGIHDELNQIHF